jgi:acetyl esterase/lipase
LHGGGYVTGSIETYRMMCGLLANYTGVKVLIPNYRLAPENPFPAALDDALKIYCWLLEQGTSSPNIIIAGDSAGGGLGVATVLALKDKSESLPVAVVCLSPWADLTLTNKTHITKAEAEAVLRTDVLREWALTYTDESNFTNPLISPVHADFHDFPPLLIEVGGDEILLGDSILLAEKAKAAGVQVELKIWNGMWHVWHALGELIPESKMAFEEIDQFVRARFNGNLRT